MASVAVTSTAAVLTFALQPQFAELRPTALVDQIVLWHFTLLRITLHYGLLTLAVIIILFLSCFISSTEDLKQ